MGFVAKKAMKTANRENPNRWAKVSRNRAHGAAGQNRSCSFKWAPKQENFRPQGRCFLLTSSFIEQIGSILGERRCVRRRLQGDGLDSPGRASRRAASAEAPLRGTHGPLCRHG